MVVMRVYSKYLSFWRTHKLHVGVAVLVVLLHAGLLYALWLARAGNLPATEPVFADVIVDKPPASAPATAAKVSRRETAKTSAVSRQRAAQTPVVASISHTSQSPAPAETIGPALTINAANGALADTPQITSAPAVISDVSLTCPVRTAPVYPLSARKLGETGKVSLRVELDETGRLVSSEVAQSSGYSRLDEAAVAAVKSWRCQPAMRDGQPLRIVSMESFEFNLND